MKKHTATEQKEALANLQKDKDEQLYLAIVLQAQGTAPQKPLTASEFSIFSFFLKTCTISKAANWLKLICALDSNCLLIPVQFQNCFFPTSYQRENLIFSLQ